MADDKLEDDKAKARARGEAGVHEPEGRGRHRLVKAADPAAEAVFFVRRQGLSTGKRTSRRMKHSRREIAFHNMTLRVQFNPEDPVKS